MNYKILITISYVSGDKNYKTKKKQNKNQKLHNNHLSFIFF